MEDSGHLAEETGYLLRDHFDAERAAPSSPNSASTPLRTYSGLRRQIVPQHSYCGVARSSSNLSSQDRNLSIHVRWTELPLAALASPNHYCLDGPRLDQNLAGIDRSHPPEPG